MGNAVAARENGKKGGRPVSAASKLTRATANALCVLGDDGLSGMADNMRFWRSKANELGELLEEQLKSASPEIQKEAMRTVGPFLAARDKYHECSRDMAPYTNPRLQAIEFRGTMDIKDVTIIDEKNATPQQAQEGYAGTLRSDNIVPMRKVAS